MTRKVEAYFSNQATLILMVGVVVGALGVAAIRYDLARLSESVEALRRDVRGAGAISGDARIPAGRADSP